MPVTISRSAVPSPQMFSSGREAYDAGVGAGAVMLDNDDDIFILGNEGDLVRVYEGRGGIRSCDPIISYPIRLAPAGLTVTFSN